MDRQPPMDRTDHRIDHLQNCGKVLVPNEFLGAEYSHRYHISPVVIHNPCAHEHLALETIQPWPAQEDVIKIIYTGAVYHAHFDAFHNLIKALNNLGRDDIQLHLYTSPTS
ncbi:MAG: hypothetical protein M0C28_19920 [Candidatus Moduliflexus flocculans]|nr:hypothetical protein [Candidatus Moduliflexus flocculans]